MQRFQIRLFRAAIASAVLRKTDPGPATAAFTYLFRLLRNTREIDTDEKIVEMNGYISDRGKHSLRPQDEEFSRVPPSLFSDQSPGSDTDRAYSQFQSSYRGDAAIGHVFGEGISNSVWPFTRSNSDRPALENIMLLETLTRLTDQVRLLNLKNNYAPCNPNGIAAQAIVPPLGLTTRSSHAYLQTSPPAASYSSPTRRRSPIEAPITDADRPAGRRQKPKHKRTETPEQLHLKPYIQNPVYTVGIDPQCIRGILHDYFEEIRRWAGFYITGFRVGEISESSALPYIGSMLGGVSNVQHMLTNSETRKDIFAGLIIRRLVEYAIGESALIKSGHNAAEQCAQLNSDYSLLDPKAFALKHQVCLEQEELYTKLKCDMHYKEWRSRAAEQHTQELLTELSSVLRPGAHPERDHVLTELYIKGYRIGFRLRMEPIKWQIVWPIAGTDVNMNCMVNQARNLFGNPATTFQRLSQIPQDFFVRFAVTPTFIRHEYSSGEEVKEVVHSSLVHVGVRGVFSHMDDAKICCMRY